MKPLPVPVAPNHRGLSGWVGLDEYQDGRPREGHQSD